MGRGPWVHEPTWQGYSSSPYRCGLPSKISLPDLASFCSSATHPLQLLLDQDLYTRYQQRGQQPDVSVVPLVTVELEHG
jgi:hypothetical protein